MSRRLRPRLEVSPLTAPLILVLLAGGTNVLRDLARLAFNLTGLR